ncbi:MAG: ABC transporter ATP-binding protein, partial [Candidatus Omnitrophica bacterium]|nr:ABC transporter ATP-binding protein [Candidatus Omnitrophota bacterium]
MKKDTKALVKRFASYYSPHRSLFVLDMGTAAFKAGLTIVIPLLVNIIFKKYLPDQNLRMLIITIAAIFTLATVVAAANYINIRWGHILGARMEADMRADLFRHLQKLSFSYFDNTKTGHIVSRISNDLFNVSEIAHHAPEDFFISICTLTGAFACMFYLNSAMALVALLPLPLLLFW